MEELLKELSNLLHISKDSLLKISESYPEFRQQYVVYSIASDFSVIAIIATIVAAISIVYANLIASDAKDLRNDKYQYEMTRSKNWMRVGVIILFSSALVFMISNIVAAVFAPDVNLIRDIVTNVKGN